MNSIEVYLTDRKTVAQGVARAIPVEWEGLNATVTEVALRSPRYAVIVHSETGPLTYAPLNAFARGFAAALHYN